VRSTESPISTSLGSAGGHLIGLEQADRHGATGATTAKVSTDDGHEAAVRARVDLAERIEVAVLSQCGGKRSHSLAIGVDSEADQASAFGDRRHLRAKAADAGLDVCMSIHGTHEPAGILPAAIMASLTCFQT
jgi:hypothetical protein